MTTNHKTLMGHRALVAEWLAQHLMNQKVLGSNPSKFFFRTQNACTSLQEKSKGKLVFIFPMGFSYDSRRKFAGKEIPNNYAGVCSLYLLVYL
jgi:hypothetical protein